MTLRLLPLFLALTLSAGTAATQLAGPGLSWNGSSGTGVRDFVPSCTNHAVSATSGESISLKIWGDVGAPFALLAAGSASQCVPFPGIGNALILDNPVVGVLAGTLTQTSPCLSCPPGFEELLFNMPRLPPGASAALQAVSFGNRKPSFTVAITVKVP